MAETVRERIVRIAASLQGTPYALPPDGVTTLDCSLYVIRVYEAAGLSFRGARTAQQLRSTCTAIDWNAVQPGDLLFAEHTYDPDEEAGADGHTASHVMISLGAGTGKAWSEQDPPGYVTEIDVRSDYWTERLFAAGRHPDIGSTRRPLPDDPPQPDKPSPPTDRWIETTDAVNLRKGPSTSGEVLQVLPPGTRLPVTGAEAEANGYRWIQTKPSGAIPGWVAKPFVSVVSDGS